MCFSGCVQCFDCGFWLGWFVGVISLVVDFGFVGLGRLLVG